MAQLNRRRFLQGGLAGSLALTLTGCGLLPRTTGPAPDQYGGALGLPDGTFGVGVVDRRGRLLWQSPVATRCHSGCNRPAADEILFFERRPGWSFYVFDRHTGERRYHIRAADGEHFVGHGVFSPDGRWLYATASRYEEGEAIVAVYDARNGYRRADTFDLGGIGPHQITLHPDGDTLVVTTKNFSEWEVAQGYGINASMNMVLTERFRRVADDEIRYSFTIEDPELYTQPWTGEMPMRPSSGLYECSCHEGNHALPGILAGARRLEIEEEMNR